MFSGMNAQFVHFTGEFHIAFRCTDCARLRYMAGRVAFRAGEVFLLSIAIRLLERAVSKSIFLGCNWLTAWYSTLVWQGIATGMRRR